MCFSIIFRDRYSYGSDSKCKHNLFITTTTKTSRLSREKRITSIHLCYRDIHWYKFMFSDMPLWTPIHNFSILYRNSKCSSEGKMWESWNPMNEVSQLSLSPFSKHLSFTYFISIMEYIFQLCMPNCTIFCHLLLSDKNVKYVDDIMETRRFQLHGMLLI